MYGCTRYCSTKIPRVREIVNFLRSKIPNLTSVVQNINTGRNNIIMGKECKILWGASHITDRLGSLKFKISALSFFQVNTEQAEKLYECALKYANLTGKETVIDGYCGTGTISLFLAQKAKKFTVWKSYLKQSATLLLMLVITI